jgi:hypothetical protein
MESALIPVAYFGISSAISLIALNVSQVQRIYFAPFILLFAMLSFRHLDDIPSWLGFSSLWGLFITIYIMHITAVLYIEKWVLEPMNDADDECVFGIQDHNHRSVSRNLKAAYKVWSNPRWLPPIPISDNGNASTEIPLGQLHPSTDAKRSTMTSFILIRTTKLCAYGLIHQLIATHIFPGHFRPMSIDDFSPHHERYIYRLLFHPTASATAASVVGDIQLRETLLRAVLAVDWVIAAYLVLEGSHHVSALLFVCVLRLDEPEEWPPLFGSMWQITSVQRFWGSFWHRLVVRPYGSHAAVLSRRLLGFEARLGVDKVFLSFCIFLFSGLAHSAVSWQMGQRCGVWRDAAWFVANFGAGAVEVVMQKLGAVLAERMGLGERYHSFASGVGGRVLGFLWVFAFFFWSVPKWQFPKIYCATLLEIYNK